MALLPLSAELAHGRGNTGRTESRAHVRDGTLLGNEVRPGHGERIRSTALCRSDKWRLDEVVVTINGKKHWLRRAVDQRGAVLDVLVQSRRDKAAAKRLMRKLLKRHGCPRVLVTDKLRSYAAANAELGLNVEHRQHKGLKNGSSQETVEGFRVIA